MVSCMVSYEKAKNPLKELILNFYSNTPSELLPNVYAAVPDMVQKTLSP